MDADLDIKTIREGLKWTQEQMADHLGLDRSSVSRMENGQPPKGSTKRLLQGLREQLARSSADASRPAPSEVAA